MNSWLTKFRISASVDSGKALPAALKKAVAQSEELSQFEERTRALERQLIQTKPKPEPLPFLHQSIMRAVAEARETGAPQSRSWRLRWLGASAALTAMLAVGLWLSFRAPATAPTPQPLAAVSTTLELGGELTRTAATGLLSPLSDELDRVNHDLDRTAQFLLASVP